MTFKDPLQETQKVKLKKFCPVCGKGVTGSGRGSLTSWLFSESRCTCEIKSVDGQMPSLARDTGSAANNVATPDQDTAKLTDRYSILSVLGQGGIGIVYKIEDSQLKRIFAAKVLLPQHAKDQAAVKRFEQEAHAARRLDHANLVTIYDQGRTNSGTPFFVMDFAPGRSLERILYEEIRLDPTRAINIFRQVLQSLDYAHTKGIVHRDLKPSNIIIGDDDFVKVVDFGIAKVIPGNAENTSKLTQVGEIFGSPAYMSPEQCTSGTIDARSDLYSIGCVMYEALTGTVPFRGENAVTTILKHLNEEAPPIRDVLESGTTPNGLENVILNALCKIPSDRYQSAQKMLNDLELVNKGKIPARRKTTLVKQKVKSRFKFVAMFSVYIIAGLAGLVWLFYMNIFVWSPQWNRYICKSGTAWNKGDSKEAFLQVEKAYAVAQKEQLSAYEWSLLNQSRAIIGSANGQYAIAVESYQRAADYAAKANYPRLQERELMSEVDLLNEVAHIHEKEGKLNLAHQEFQRDLSLAKQVYGANSDWAKKLQADDDALLPKGGGNHD